MIQTAPPPYISGSESHLPHDKPLWKKMLHFLPVILIVSGLTVFLNQFGWTDGIQNATLDVIAQTRSLRPVDSLLVEVDENDYSQIFKRTSPMSKEGLARIISAVASGHPKMIVVDIDTSTDVLKDVTLPPDCSIVFGRLVQELPKEQTSKLFHVREAELAMRAPCKRSCFVVPPASELNESNSKSTIAGIAFLPRDVDGRVRRYCRKLQTVNEADSNSVQLSDSLPWAIAKAYRPELSKKESFESNEVFLAFDTDESVAIPSISAGTLLKMQDTVSAASQVQSGVPKTNSSDEGSRGWSEIAKDKIVFIGATFKDSRDTYKTIAGETPGVKLIAQAVETELEYGGIRFVDEPWSFIAQLLASILFVYINARYNRTLIPLVGLIAIPFAALVFSLLAFSTFALWANFVPVLFAVQLHALFNHIENIKRNNRELKAANIELNQKNAELVQTRKELGRAIDVGGQKERHRVAMRLHAETLMELFKLETKLDPLRQETSQTQIYNDVYDALQGARKNVRDVMDDLYPSSMRGGLAAAVKSLAQQSSSSGFAVSLVDERAMTSNISADDELRIYRIVQNAVRNVIEHSGADQCEVWLADGAGMLLVEVRDNGVGFQSLTGRPNSRGVMDMQELAELMNATIDWVTPSKKFDKGTDLVLKIPTDSLSPTADIPSTAPSPDQS